MLVLFDQSTPVPLRPFLKGHTVETAWQRGWDTLRNGDLLKAAEEAGFDVLVTPDKSIQHQQNLSKYKIAIVSLGKSAMANPAPECGPRRGGSECRNAGKLLRSRNSGPLKDTGDSA